MEYLENKAIKLFLVPFISTLGYANNNLMLTIAADMISPILPLINDTLTSRKVIKLIVYLLFPVVAGFIHAKTLMYFDVDTKKIKREHLKTNIMTSFAIGLFAGYFAATLPLNIVYRVSLSIMTAFTNDLVEIGILFAHNLPYYDKVMAVIFKLLAYMIGFVSMSM